VLITTSHHDPQARSFRAEKLTLNYLDPGEVDPDAWAGDPDTLVLPRAGEDLYRLR
jgi:hypothetical protein